MIKIIDIDILKDMTLTEIVLLSEMIGKELMRRSEEIEQVKKIVLENTQQTTFDIEAERNDGHKPYVAKMSYNEDSGRLDKTFKDIPHCKSAMAGSFTAGEGEILDIRSSNDKAFYIVFEGQLRRICDSYNDMGFTRIKQYLSGQMTRDTFLEIYKIKELETDVIDDLRDDDE